MKTKDMGIRAQDGGGRTTPTGGDPQDRTIIGWMSRSKPLSSIMNRGLYRTLHDALADAGLEGPEDGLLDAICHGHPRTGRPVTGGVCIMYGRDVAPFAYRCLADSIAAYADGMDPWKVTLMESYELSSAMRRCGHDDWEATRRGLFLDCLRDGDPALVPARGAEGVREWRRQAGQGYVIDVSRTDCTPWESYIGVADLYYMMDRSFDDPMGVLRRLGWRAAADLMILTRHTSESGMRGADARRLAMECLDRGPAAFDTCMDVLAKMTSSWEGRAPTVDDICANVGLPASFVLETVKSSEPESMKCAEDMSICMRAFGDFAYWYRSLAGAPTGRYSAVAATHRDCEERILRKLKSAMTSRDVSVRASGLEAIKAMRAVPDDVYDMCDGAYDHAVAKVGDILMILEDGADSLTRCSLLMAALCSTRRDWSSVPSFGRLDGWMRRYVKDGTLPGSVKTGKAAFDAIKGMPSDAGSMAELLESRGGVVRSIENLRFSL